VRGTQEAGRVYRERLIEAGKMSEGVQKNVSKRGQSRGEGKKLAGGPMIEQPKGRTKEKGH